MVDRETYLKTQQLADALGVSISSVKRWVDKGAIEATRTMGKHRLVALSVALKFARDEKYPTENLLALSGQPPVSKIDDRLVEALLEALRYGLVLESSAIIRAAFLADRDAVALADHLIRPVMERIGQLWFVGAWDVYQERQAIQIIAGTVTELIRTTARSHQANHRPLALGGAPEGDIYNLPTILAELVLREEGWEVKNLGTHLPIRSMASAIRDYRPKLVFLSASYVQDRSRFLQDYAYFYEAASQVGAAIILGGRAFDADLRSRLVYASFGERMAHLGEFARLLLPASETTLGSATNHPGQTDIST